MTVARGPAELEARPRAVAIGVFDGVHRGHRAVLDAAIGSGLVPTVVTFHPHPREMLGYGVELISTIERRLELLAGAGIEDVLVVEFTDATAATEPEDFVESVLRPIGTEAVFAGEDFRFGHKRAGDLELLRRLGFDAHGVPLAGGISSSEIRRLAHDGDVGGAARLLGRPLEVDGIVVSGDARGGTLGYPTANLRVEPDLLVPRYGIYAGALADGTRAALSIGTNPHYGGDERRIEAFLLDFAGDLYGRRLVVQLWERLRDEAVFASEQELIAQIGEDVAATRRARSPA